VCLKCVVVDYASSDCKGSSADSSGTPAMTWRLLGIHWPLAAPAVLAALALPAALALMTALARLAALALLAGVVAQLPSYLAGWPSGLLAGCLPVCLLADHILGRGHRPFSLPRTSCQAAGRRPRIGKGSHGPVILAIGVACTAEYATGLFPKFPGCGESSCPFPLEKPSPLDE
jgi:hypothetical protein